MGDVVRTRIRIGAKRAFEGEALLETSELVVRGAERVVVPFASITRVAAEDGELAIEHAKGRVAIALGARAAKWAEKIANPKTPIEKLGIKEGARVSIVASPDASLAEALRARGVDVHEAAWPRAESDAIVFGVSSAKDLGRFATLARSLTPAGALWTIRRKGDPNASEAAVRAAALDAGLVDVKVVRFSDTHTAEKFVVPKAKRK